MASFQGNLENIDLASVFQNLLNNAQTGTLIVTPGAAMPLRTSKNDASDRHVHFEGGAIRMISPNAGELLGFGGHLVAAGVISEEDLSAASKKVKRRTTLTAALIKRGAPGDEVKRAIRACALEHIYELFTFKNGSFRFVDGEPDEEVFDPDLVDAGLRIEVNEVILEAARRMDEWDRIHKVLASPREVYILRRERMDAVEQIEDPHEQEVARLLDGRRDVGAVVEDAPLGRFYTFRAIASLVRENLARSVSTSDLFQFAESSADRNDWMESVRLYRRVLEVERNNTDARRKLAEALKAMGDREGAATEHKLMASQLQETGDREGAAAAYEKAVELAPSDVDCRQRLLNLLIAMEDYERAHRTGLELGARFGELGLAEKARDTYRQLLGLPIESPNPVREALADAHAKVGEVREGVTILVAMADEHLTARRDAEAVLVLRKAQQLDVNNPDVTCRLQEIESGKLERRRARRRQLKRAFVSLLILTPLFGWLVYDTVARVELQRMNRQAHMLAAKHTEQDLETIRQKYLKVKQKYPLTWVAMEANSLQKFYEEIIIPEFLYAEALKHKERGERAQARQLLTTARNEYRPGSDLQKKIDSLLAALIAGTLDKPPPKAPPKPGPGASSPSNDGNASPEKKLPAAKKGPKTAGTETPPAP